MILSGVLVTILTDTTPFSGEVDKLTITKEFVVLTNQIVQTEALDPDKYVIITASNNIIVSGVIKIESILRHCVQLSWPTEVGKVYILETRPAVKGTWQEVRVKFHGTGSTLHWFHNSLDPLRQWRLKTL